MIELKRDTPVRQYLRHTVLIGEDLECILVKISEEVYLWLIGVVPGKTFDHTLGELWDNCPRWDWARYVLEKLDAPLYDFSGQIVPPSAAQRSSMLAIRRCWTPFKEDLVEKQPETVPKEAVDVLVRRLNRMVLSLGDQAVSPWACDIVSDLRQALAEYRRLMGEDTVKAARTRVRYVDDDGKSFIGIQFSDAEVLRACRIAENVHILVDEMMYLLCSVDRTLCEGTGETVHGRVQQALSAYRTAVEEKPKPERGKKYRHKRTGAVLFFGGKGEDDADVNGANHLGEYWLAPDFDHPECIYVDIQAFERDWEEVEQKNSESEG